MRRWLTTGVLGAALLVAPFAHADPPHKKPPQPMPTWVPLTIAGVGGAVVAVGGGATFRLTGAARGLATAASAATLVGGSWASSAVLAGLYALGCDGSKGDVLRSAPLLEAEASTVYSAGPALAPAVRFGTGVTTRLGPMGLHLGTSVAPATRYDRVESSLLYRPFGATPGRPASNGGFFELAATGAHTRHGALGFDVTDLDLVAAGRLDLSVVGRPLRGSFVELSGGAAVRSLAFDHGATSARPDMALLFRTAFGVSIGRFGAPFRGEVKVYYDHRHDDDAGGLLGNGVVSGVFGHVGAEGLFLSPSGWGARAYGEFGSAGVVGLSLLYRIGGLR